ncbi:hypothetical protein [Streptomyces sp. NBC_01244]|uniref:hypothetical protein n=1 Tax=Streptomyces sp. NBC_01244 TaxID=2903797 RepID=UPI002E1094F6|nr:hypothetical protein OG247_28720 [Streptomyces sp. NBC_01244]
MGASRPGGGISGNAQVTTGGASSGQSHAPRMYGEGVGVAEVRERIIQNVETWQVVEAP